MNLREAIKKKKFIVTSETAPPKGTDVSKMIEQARLLVGKVDAINVTDLQSAVMRLGSLTGCYLLKQIGIDPIFQITCRDRNRLSLSSELLSASVLGIKNVLVLTGDHPLNGDHPEAKPVFDLDAVQLLRAAKNLCLGRDMSGNRLYGVPDFCLGAVVNPCADPLEPELIKMKKKIDSGAQFFQTQAVFDVKRFSFFMKKVSKYNVPIIAGIILLKSTKMAAYMNDNVAGVYVPPNLMEQIDNALSKEEESVKIACGIINKLKDVCNGVHIMPIGWERLVPGIIDRAGIKK
ncbi:MAG: 5,10-methylenetetrahydrofolate reductase [Dehalococcoidia bacterium]|nr:MAG: 5,10-methylenetetrahydrofolate reductase [Dehalococcoidia bacterium]